MIVAFPFLVSNSKKAPATLVEHSHKAGSTRVMRRLRGPLLVLIYMLDLLGSVIPVYGGALFSFALTNSPRLITLHHPSCPTQLLK